MVHDTSHNRSDNDVIGDYRPGSIQRVKLHNFLTHANVEFKPGPRYVVVFIALPKNKMLQCSTESLYCLS